MAQKPRNRFPMVNRLGRMAAPRRNGRRGGDGREAASFVASVLIPVSDRAS